MVFAHSPISFTLNLIVLISCSNSVRLTSSLLRPRQTGQIMNYQPGQITCFLQFLQKVLDVSPGNGVQMPRVFSQAFEGGLDGSNVLLNNMY